jgi:hypothetical protein
MAFVRLTKNLIVVLFFPSADIKTEFTAICL